MTKPAFQIGNKEPTAASTTARYRARSEAAGRDRRLNHERRAAGKPECRRNQKALAYSGRDCETLTCDQPERVALAPSSR
jgi:hypothetical protein